MDEVARVWYIDVPNPEEIGADKAFTNIGVFTSKKEALEWARQNIDENISDDGELRILSTG